MYIDDPTRLHHMLDTAREALAFVQNKSRSDLDNDRVLTLALVKSLEIIGEAASKITRNFRNANPQIAWRDLIDFRNRLIHNYYDFDLNTAWDVTTMELPLLIAELEKLVPADAP